MNLRLKKKNKKKSHRRPLGPWTSILGGFEQFQPFLHNWERLESVYGSISIVESFNWLIWITWDISWLLFVENLASDGFGPVLSIKMRNFTDFQYFSFFCQKVLSQTITELVHYFTLLFPRHSHNARRIYLCICLSACLSVCLSVCVHSAT